MPFDASVRAYLRAYQNEYRAALHGGQHTAELSFRVPMHEMFRRIAHDLNPAGTFDIILEPRNQGRMGRPDWRIQDRISLGVYGYIEAKGPSNEPFDTTPYRDQINRYLTLGHKLIITDGIDFVFCFTETPVVVSIIDKARMDALDWSRLPVDPLFRFYMEQFFSNPAPQRVDEEKLVELVAIRTRNLADEIREYSDLTIEEAMNEDEHHMIQRFKKYIDDTPFISGIISDAIGEVDYDWQNCFRQSKHSGWHEIEVPVDEACHVKAMYDYLDYIISNGSNILGIAMHYPHSQKKFNEIIQHFLDIAFKPLIDFINDAISKEMILMEEQKPLGVTQNIGTVYGTVNQQGGGTINSETTVLAGNLDQIAEIEKMIEKILPHLDDIPDIPKDAADDVKDDLESVKEQINAPAPKKKRLQKAIGGIKKFFGDFSPQLAAALAAHAITTTDWNAMIASVEKLISSL